MPMIEIDNVEAGQLMFVLANAEGKGITWAVVNPLLMKIGGQLRHQATAGAPNFPTQQPRGNGGMEAPDGS